MRLQPIDWSRVAEPQGDGYDIRVTLEQLETGPYKDRPRKQIPPGLLNVWPEGQAVFVTLFDTIRPSSNLRDVDPRSPIVQEGLALINTWPVIRPHCAHLTKALCALTSGAPQSSRGCTCGNFGDDWGWIYVTADNQCGFAEGIVHEMAHWKLRALGVWFEDWTDMLLENPMDARYVSPVRKDMERPMGAVLHAQYSYVHVAAMCVAMLKADQERKDVSWVELQLSRITEGRATLQEHARGTPGVGVPFLEGLDAWTSRVLEEGYKVLGGLMCGCGNRITDDPICSNCGAGVVRV